ncbi:MAG: cytochrome-c peroxidase [Gammaproteobacteria bacterium]|nr:cytochrome-c peroxidase [Gammaproteobacteria bacterium]
MNAYLSDILILGLIFIAVSLIILVNFVFEMSQVDKNKWFLGIGLGSGIIAFSLKIMLIVTISSFPTQALELFPKKEYIKESAEYNENKKINKNSHYSHGYSWKSLPEIAPSPIDNPTTPEKIALGKKLFFDKRLSFDNSISCASCHELSKNKGGGDGLDSSIGIDGKKGTRNAPSVFNTAFQNVLFWDGRANSLEEQAVGPILNPIEMGMPSIEAVEKKISSIEEFQELFPEVFPDDSSITIKNIAKAIAAFERTLITPDSPYDQFIKGDVNALTEQQKRGMALFESVGCIQCHSGPNFSGSSFISESNNGAFRIFPANSNSKYISKYLLSDDLGVVENFTGLNKGNSKGVWRIPSLRNINITAPYFHNGSVTDLNEAVRIMANAQLNKNISNNRSDDSEIYWSTESKQIFSTENQALDDGEINDIVDFLKSLTGKIPEHKS